MAQPVKIRLKKIQYTGQPIGNDIKVEVNIDGRHSEWKQKMKLGSIAEPNVEIAKLDNSGTFEVNIKIIEKDFIFSDEGETNGTIRLEPSLPQTFDFEVKVQERRKLFRKKTAVFLITLEAEQSQQVSVIRPKPYNLGPNGEDYNLYDVFIAETVYHWNQEFNVQTNSPPVLLDPNLVKAIIYVESKMGHYPVKKGHYPSYPDVMQMANPTDPGIHVLRDDRLKKTEYEIQEGKIVHLFYPDANGNSPQESIKWGVRWLYHKAQIIKGNQRVWLDWKKAVKRYGPGTIEYQDKVWNIYTQGVDHNGNKLWSVAIITVLLALSSFWSSQRLIPVYFENKVVLGVEDSAPNLPKDKEQILKEVAQGCESFHGNLNEAYILANSTYVIEGEYPPNKKHIQLTGGHYSYERAPGREWETYETEKNGPYSIDCEKIERGDLNLDGLEDAIVVLRINNGGVGHFREIFAMQKTANSRFIQSDVLKLGNREEVHNLKIENGILFADLLLKKPEDPECCPTLWAFKKLKLENSELIEIK